MPHRIPSRGRSHAHPFLTATLAAAWLATSLAAGPAAAKEGLEARLDAPIAGESPGGTVLIVGVTMLGPAEDGTLAPIDGMTVYLELTGPDGSGTRAPGTGEGGPGHYVFVIRVPDGGPRGVEVGASGEEDLPFPLAAEAIVPGPISAGTAQAAPADGAAEADRLATVIQPAAGQGLLALGLGIAGLVLLLIGGTALAVLVRRRERHRRAAPDLGG